MSGLKRLTPQQSRKANALIKKTCCNCMGGNCILLDDGDECVCPQLISYSLLCRWFQNAVLPADKLLYAELYQAEDRRRCAECGAAFASTSNSVKYCPDCRKRITRRQAADAFFLFFTRLDVLIHSLLRICQIDIRLLCGFFL